MGAGNNPIPLAALHAFQPYEDQCLASFVASENAICSFHAISGGKRLVIQEVDVRVAVASGLRPVVIEVSPSGGQLDHFFTATFMGSDNGGVDHFATHQETRLYAGQNVTRAGVEFLTNTASAGIAIFTLSGFLVDVP